jgi:two-component system NtrC family sensor kinase
MAQGSGTSAAAPRGDDNPIASEAPVRKAQPMPLMPIRAMLVASLVVPAVVLALFAWHSRTHTILAAQSRAQRLAAVIQEHSLKVFETIDLVLRAADRRLAGASWNDIATSPAIWDDLKKLQQSGEQIGAIFVVDRDGFGPLTTRAFPAPRTDFADRDYYFEQRAADRGLYVGQAYTGKISKDQIFNFSIRRTSPNGAFDGVIGISAYVEYFANYYRSVGIPADDFAIALVRDDGNVLVRYPELGGSSSKIPSDSPFLRNLTSDRGTFFTPSPFTGQDRLYGYVKIRGYPIYAFYGINERAITADWLRTTAWAASLAALVAACLFLTAWFALQRAKQEALAVQRLTQKTQELGQEIERRERAEASLLQAQRLEAVGQLTGGIAHDFNNLLTVISGNLELADRKNDLPTIRRLLKSIRYAADRAANLTRQLLTFSRRHMLNPRTVDLNVVIERTRVLVEHSVPDSIALAFTLAADPCPVHIDVSEFEAAVLNVVANARDAMPNGGRLALSVREAVLPDDAVAHGPALPPGRYVVLCVEDVGVGMSPETLARVYEPFFTTKEVGKGTGLGLSQVYGFMQQSGGAVAIDSAPGRGTRVSMILPRSSEVVAGDARAPAGALAPGRRATVLVVEDDSEVRGTSIAMVQDLGHNVLIARTGAEALALVTAGQPIDVLLTDLVMPGGMSGVELAMLAAAAAPALKIVITTGYPGHPDLLRSQFPVLPKPFTRLDLDAMIRSLVEPGVAPLGAA